MQKKIHVRIEHVKPSRCREEFLRRVNENRDKNAAAKKSGTLRLISACDSWACFLEVGWVFMPMGADCP